MDISGLDKAAVLAALYNASRPVGLGILSHDPAPMTIGEARALIGEDSYIDYLKGRPLKVDLGSNDLDTWLYNRDNGEGAAERALSSLLAERATGPVIDIVVTHNG